ncbi:hypothetical protein QN239_32785 [Mycolicibacterium sp. Y3]
MTEPNDQQRKALHAALDSSTLTDAFAAVGYPVEDLAPRPRPALRLVTDEDGSRPG